MEAFYLRYFEIFRLACNLGHDVILKSLKFASRQSDFMKILNPLTNHGRQTLRMRKLKNGRRCENNKTFVYTTMCVSQNEAGTR
jgi:hypothetical protein